MSGERRSEYRASQAMEKAIEKCNTIEKSIFYSGRQRFPIVGAKISYSGSTDSSKACKNIAFLQIHTSTIGKNFSYSGNAFSSTIGKNCSYSVAL